MKNNYFITVEGIDGAGKSTAVNYIKQLLEAKNKSLTITREPGGTEIAEQIRHVLLAHHDESMHEDTELLLMFASRAQHIAQVIRPALAAGKTVICDRFTDTSFAYQGGGRGIARERIADLADWVHKDLQPELTILMDVPVKIGLKRARKAGNPDRFEVEKTEFFERIRHCYLAQAKQYPERYRVVDTAQSLDKIKLQLQQILDEIV